MDPMFLACSFFRRKKFQECVNLCNQLLEKNSYDQVRSSSCSRAPPHIRLQRLRSSVSATSVGPEFFRPVTEPVTSPVPAQAGRPVASLASLRGVARGKCMWKQICQVSRVSGGNSDLEAIVTTNS